MIQLRMKTLEFPMGTDIDDIVCVAGAMRDSFHRPSKLKGSSKNSCVTCPITRTQTSEVDERSVVNSRLRSSGTRDRCVETPSTNNPDSSEDFVSILIEWFTPDSHKIVFNKVGDEQPGSDVDKRTRCQSR